MIDRHREINDAEIRKRQNIKYVGKYCCYTWKNGSTYKQKIKHKTIDREVNDANMRKRQKVTLKYI